MTLNTNVAIQSAGKTGVLNKAGLAISGGNTTYDTANTVQYQIAGRSYAKTAVTGGTTPVVDVRTGLAFNALTANKGCVLWFGFDASGNPKVAQSEIKDLDSSGNFLVYPQIPHVLNSAMAIFGYAIVKGGSTLASAWLPGTNNWNTTGITVSVVDIIDGPAQPVG